MSEIRINNIPTTAASTASDDFFAIDGSNNNTRKLSAYSPTFGGNLVVNGSVVSGSGTSSFAGTATISGTASSDLLSYNLLLGGVKRLILGYDATNDYGLIASVHTGQAWKPLVINPIGGNVIVGTTSDGGQKFQVNGAAAISGNIILSTNNAYLQTKTSGGSLVSLMALTTDNITRFINGVDAGGFQWTNQAQTVAWASLTSSLLSVNGNLTVSGTGNSSVAGNLGIGETSPVVPLHVKTTGTGTGDFDNAIATLRSTAAGRTITLQFSDTTNQSYISSKSGALNFGVGGATLGMSLSSGGNLTVSGTGNNVFRGTIRWGNTSYPGFNGYITETNTASQLIPAITRNLIGTTGNTQYTIANAELGAYAAFELGADIRWFAGSGTFTTGQTITPTELMRLTQGGNLLIGTTTDSSALLQVGTNTTTAAGGMKFGTDVSLYRSGADQLTSNSSGTANNFFLRHSTTAAGGFQVQIDSSKDVYLFQRENRLMYIGTNNTTALTLDSSQNATFAKDIFLGTSGPSVKSTLSARAPRQGLVFDGTAGASANVGTIGSSPVSFGGRCTIPASGTNVLFAISASATTPAQPKALAIYTFGTSLYVQLNAAIGNYLLGEVSGFVTTYAGKVVDIVAVRSASGNIALYVNGVATSPSFSSVGGSAPANWQADIDGPYALLGITSVSAWVAGTFYPPVCYNRALSASEVVALYEAGAPAGADYNSASNTSLITGDNSTFASDTGYWTKSSATISGGNLNLSSDGSSIFRANLLVIGKKYRYVTSISANTTSVLIGSGSGAGYGTVTTTGTITGEFTATSTTFVIYQSGAGAATVGDITLFSLGLLLAPDAAQAGGGLTWYDTSGNAANISWTSGVSWNVPSSRVLGGNWTTSGTLGVNKVAGGEASVASTLQITSPAVSETGAGGLEWKADVANNGYGFRTLPVFNGVSSYDLYTQSRSNSASWTTRMSLTNTGNLLIGTTNDAPNARLHVLGANNAGLRIDQGSYNYYSAYEHIFQAVSFGTIYGKFANNGSLILKSDGVDSGNGRLQLATHTTSAGGIGFGTDTSLFRAASGNLGLYGTGTSSKITFSHSTTTAGKGFEVECDTAKDGYVWNRENRNIFLGTNNTLALTLDSSQNATFAGKIGIGVSPSSWNLNLQQSAVNSAVRIISPTALGLNDSSIYIAWASGSKALISASYESTGSYRPLVLSAGGVDSLTLDTSGNATFAGQITASGISHKLGSGGTGSANALLTIDGSSASNYGSYIVLQRNSTNKWQFGTYSGINGGTSDDFLLYNPTAANEALKIAAATSNATLAGNLTVSGTGTSSVAGAFTVGVTSGALTALNDFYHGSGGTKGFWNDTGLYGPSTGDFIIRAGNDFNSTILAGNSSGSQVVIKANGNFLIGKTTPDTGEKLQVSGTAAIAGTTKITNGNLQVYGYVGNNALAAIFLNEDQSSYIYNDGAQVNFRSGGVDGLKLASGTGNATFAGTVTTSTTNTSQNAGNGNKLISSGAVWVVNAATNDAFSYYNSSASAYRFYVDSGGTISATNTAISAISDARLKENIRDLSGGLSSILALKPRVFDWKEGKGANKKNVRGFIAQEIEQVFPDLVDEWKDPAPDGESPYKSVRQDLIPVLVKAIQELKAEIDALKATRS